MRQFASLWPQHANLVHFGKPEGMIGTHHDPKRLAARCRNTIGDEPVRRDVQTRNRIFRQNRHPYLANRGHGQAVEPARMGIAEWCSVGGESASARIEAEQETAAESGHPDDALRVAGNLHGRHIGTWWRKQADAAGGRVEATNMFAAHFSEPDHALWIDGHA